MTIEIPCACGCGAMVRTPDRQGRRRQFVSGHNMLGTTVSEVTRDRMRLARRKVAAAWRAERGIILTRREVRAINASRRRAEENRKTGLRPAEPNLSETRNE